MIWAALLAGSVAAGAVGLWVALVPRRVDLAVEVGRWEAGRARLELAAAPVGTDGRNWRDRVGRWLAEASALRGVEMPNMRADLAVLERPVHEHMAGKVTVAFVGLLTPAVTMVMLTAAAGADMPLPLPAVVGIGLAVGLFFLPDVQLHAEAERRRAELRQALGQYLDLVAMNMASGRGTAEALPMAAAMGQEWAFELLGETVRRARYVGITPWQAFADLGDRTDVQELRDLGGALKGVGEEGAKVRASLAARAATLRRRRLAEVEAAAGKASQQITVAQVILAIPFLLFLGYPGTVTVLSL